jgi:hypothetical protein
MHKLIRVLVFAPDSNSALDAAHKVVHEKLRTESTCSPFDYNMSNGSIPMGIEYGNKERVFERKRCGNLPKLSVSRLHLSQNIEVI